MHILLVEDNAGDVALAKEAFKTSKFAPTIHVVGDGVDALSYLRRQGKFHSAVRPDLILLDLGLPRKSGREVLLEIKEDVELTKIPIVVLSGSPAESDLVQCYNLHACYLYKPMGFDGYLRNVQQIEDFWILLSNQKQESESVSSEPAIQEEISSERK